MFHHHFSSAHSRIQDRKWNSVQPSVAVWDSSKLAAWASDAATGPPWWLEKMVIYSIYRLIIVETC